MDINDPFTTNSGGPAFNGYSVLSGHSHGSRRCPPYTGLTVISPSLPSTSSLLCSGFRVIDSSETLLDFEGDAPFKKIKG